MLVSLTTLERCKWLEEYSQSQPKREGTYRKKDCQEIFLFFSGDFFVKFGYAKLGNNSKLKYFAVSSFTVPKVSSFSEPKVYHVALSD